MLFEKKRSILASNNLFFKDKSFLSLNNEESA